eukprot:scaffold1402_cov403-Prasinococcus_capsulatus_cf.AAC.6
MYGIVLARSASRPRMVVSTRKGIIASPFGFSTKSVILPVSSIFIKPKAEASSSVHGRAATVISAAEVRWAAMKFW